jgi:septation ring formation regulator EzrA
VAVAESTGKLVTKIDSVNIPGNIFEEKLFPATQSISNSLENLASKIQAQHAPFDDMYEVISRTSDSLSNIEAHAAHLSRFSEVLKNTEDTMGNLSREIAGVSEGYRLLQEKNKEVSEVTEAELKQRSQRIQELSRDYDSQAASLHKIEEVLSREASNIEAVSEKFAGAITKLAIAIASDLEK